MVKSVRLTAAVIALGLAAAIIAWRSRNRGAAAGRVGAGEGDATGANRDRRTSAPTRAELYRRAQALGVEGRSKMTKEELRRAVEAHDLEGAPA